MLINFRDICGRAKNKNVPRYWTSGCSAGSRHGVRLGKSDSLFSVSELGDREVDIGIGVDRNMLVILT